MSRLPKQSMAFETSQTPAMNGTLVYFLFCFGTRFINTKKKKIFLAFVSYHELSLTFIIWSSSISPIWGHWSELGNKAITHSHLFLWPPVAVPFKTAYCNQTLMAGNGTNFRWEQNDPWVVIIFFSDGKGYCYVACMNLICSPLHYPWGHTLLYFKTWCPGLKPNSVYSTV